MASLMIADIYVRLRPCHARHLGAGVLVGAAVCSQGFSLESAARGAQIRVSWDLDTVYRGLTCCQCTVRRKVMKCSKETTNIIR